MKSVALLSKRIALMAFACLGSWGMHAPAARGEVLSRDNAPSMLIVEPATSGATDQREQRVVVQTPENAGAAPRMTHNGVVAPPPSDPPERKDGRLYWTFAIQLVEGANRLEFRANNELNHQSEAGVTTLTLTYNKPLGRPELHVLAVGISRYSDETINLSCSANDAKMLAAALNKHANGDYRAVHTTVLTDESATRRRIIESCKLVAAQCRPKDTVVLLFSGHGGSDGEQFYFMPSDNDRRQPLQSTAVSQAKIEELLQESPARHRVVIYDASAAVRPSSARGTHVISSGDQSFELRDEEHGALTYALLAALGEVDSGPLRQRPIVADGQVTVLEWFAYAEQHVPGVTRAQFGREQTPFHSSHGTDFPLFATPNVGIKTQEQEE